MQLDSLDWTVIIVFFVILLGIGFWSARGAGKSAASYFLAGRGMAPGNGYQSEKLYHFGYE